jgi:MtN3 and saliva related transmembrane protein
VIAAGWFTESIGSVAAVCTTVAFVPQLLRVWRRKSADDISLIMFLLFSTGVGLWLVYGIRIGSFPVATANALTLALALAILFLKLHYARQKRHLAATALDRAQ